MHAKVSHMLGAQHVSKSLHGIYRFTAAEPHAITRDKNTTMKRNSARQRVRPGVRQQETATQAGESN